MYKFEFNFVKIIYQFASCMKLYRGKLDQTKKKEKDFLKPKLIHKHHGYL